MADPWKRRVTEAGFTLKTRKVGDVDFSFLPDGTLNGAMRQEDADEAMSLLPHGTYRRVDATHVVHLAAPELYVQILEEFCHPADR